MKKRSTLMSALIIMGVVAGIVGLIIKNRMDKNAITMVRVERPEVGTLVEFVSAPGRIEPKEKVKIRSRISAKIVNLPYKEGDWVYQGDPNHNPPIEPSVLIELDSKDVNAELEAQKIRRDAMAGHITAAQAELESSKAAVEGQRAVLEQAQKELQRKESLLEANGISQSSLDQQQSTVDNLKAQLESAEEGLRAAELSLVASKLELEAADADITRVLERLKYTKITAPMDGIIIKLNASVGEMATGSQYNPGNVLVEVADVSQMLLVARVDEFDIPLVEEGQNAKVHIHAWQDQVFEGKVVSTALALTQELNEKYFEAEILLDNEEGEIFSGLAADVDIEVNTYHDILKIPSHAVVDYEIDLLPKDIRENSPEVDKSKILVPVVFRYVKGEARVAPIAFGRSDATHTIIKSGISQDDEIVTGPYKVLESLRHLQKVKKEKDMSEEEAQASRNRLDELEEDKGIFDDD